MTMDRRFPNFVRVQDAPIPDRHRALAIADAVGRRTGTQCAYDRLDGSLFFYYGTLDAPAFAFPFLGPKGGALPVSDTDVDDMVRLIQMGKLDRKAKDRIAAENVAQQQYAEQQEQQRFEDARRPDAQHYADFLDRKRRGTQKVTV